MLPNTRERRPQHEAPSHEMTGQVEDTVPQRPDMNAAAREQFTKRRCVRCGEWFEPEGRYDYVCTSTCAPDAAELTGVCPICGETSTAARRDKRTCGKAGCKKALQRKAAKSERWALAAKVVPLYHRDGKPLRLCECGCRKPLTGAAQQRFHDDACRKRHARRRPTSMSHLTGEVPRDTRVNPESGQGQLQANDSGPFNKIEKANSDASDHAPARAAAS
jgi:ribosomal protein S27AE